jgi:transcriptional regulator with XRE-family HTH domain
MLGQFRDLSEYLEARIRDTGMSARAVSVELGYSPTYLSSLINGYVAPSIKATQRIAAYFGDDPLDVLRFVQPINPRTVQDELPTVASLIADYVLRHLPEDTTQLRRQDVEQVEPGSAVIEINGQRVPLYLPAAAERYTPEQLARLFVDFLEAVL